MKLLAVLLLLAGCVPRAALRPRGLTPATSTEEVLHEALAPRRVALLVGVDRYDDPAFEPLRHAAADARALAELLRQPDGGFDHVSTLTGSVSREELFAALRLLAQQVRRDDELVLYFAGHGTRMEVEGVEHRFLLTTDSSTADIERTAVDLEALLAWVRELAPVRRGVIVDACFDGGGRSVTRPGAPSASSAGQDLRLTRLGPGDIEALATTPDRPAMEDDAVGHGVYTWYLLQAASWGFREADLDDDGVLTLWEAHDHARGRVIEHTNGAQVPEALLRTVGEADVVLRGREEDRRQRDTALLYLYPRAQTALSGVTVEVDGRARGSLPGTIAVAPGRHTLTLYDRDGAILASGPIEVEGGRATRLDQLIPTLNRERGGVAVRAMGWGAPGLEEAIGPAAGLTLALDARPAPVRIPGLSIGAHLDLLAAGSAAGARPLLGGGVDLAGQVERQRARLRLGWGASGWWAPPRLLPEGVSPLAAPGRAGWRFFATGPRMSGGLLLGRGWWVDGAIAVEGTGLVLEEGGAARFVPIVQGGVGLRATF